jgi:hypothetical protein
MSPLMPFPQPRERQLLFLKRSPCFPRRKVSIRASGAVLLIGFLVAALGDSSAQAQTWISLVSASTTANGAGITWITAVPSDSQVEYGTTAAYGSMTPLAAGKVIAHSIALTGLTAGTTYHFRVRSGDASGLLIVGPDNTLKLVATLSLAASPANLSFGAVALQKCSAVQLTTLTSTGTGSATLGPSALTGANGADFVFGGLGSCHSGQVLAPGASCTDSLKFCPTAAGSRSAADTISNDTPSSPIVVSLNGTGSAATLSLVASPANLNFGTVALQQCSAVQLTTLTSNGSSSATIGASALTGANGGDFAFGGVGSCHSGQVLAPGASCTDSLKFCPTAAGSRSAADTIPNDTPGSPAVVSLNGTASAATPALAVNPTSLSFTGQVGTSNITAASVSIRNAGAGTLSFTGVSDQPWLMLSAGSGTAPSTLQVSPSITAMKAGTYTGHVTLSGGGTTKAVTVVLTLAASPPAQHSVVLSWKASTNPNIVSYSLYRSTIAGSSYALLASALGTASYSDQSVQSGTIYYYVVTAVDDSGRESTYSNESRATVP